MFSRPDVSFGEVRRHHLGQMSCRSCADITDSSHWELMEPSVTVENNGVVVYKHRSPSGSFECAVSGLRWVCANDVNVQYQFGNPDMFRADLAMLQYTPIGPLLDIRVLAGELLEAHLPHFACLGGSGPSLTEAVRVLHGSDGTLTLEQCELTRYHARLLKPSFSVTEVMVKFGIPVKSHLDVMIYRTRFIPLTFYVYAVPRDASMIQAVEEELGDHQHAKKIKKIRPDVSMWMNSRLSLTSSCPAEISPPGITLKYIRPPDFFEVFMENPKERFDLELKCKEQCVWKATMRMVEYDDTAEVMAASAARDSKGAVFRGASHRLTSTDARETGAAGKLTNKDLLFKLRLGLIQRLSGGTLRDVLDGLQRERVISQTEAGYVLERSRVRRDQMTSLVDMVFNKGEAACDVTLHLLQELDPYLYMDLSSPPILSSADIISSITFITGSSKIMRRVCSSAALATPLNRLS
ncbi:NACHT, LRR and PYD domains-containing protein 1 homolog [Engraulis encrasicolus]|uniref:NACHT, LRR and PYD domains-containing protein 1 homolog n=1 Tax=Engraulis encrasicolus TaxID=184585 RepID=UPI002FD3469D